MAQSQSFSEWFRETTDKQPFPYQVRFAEELEGFEILQVMTGAGKTATIVLGWLWRRCFHPNQRVRDATPKRLVYCLPMRSLVEQTYQEVEGWLAKAGLQSHPGETVDQKSMRLALLMGGAVSDRWDMYPEEECILIGTQDQLLSRALNRGYGMSRYRWSIHFALLNNDCLWVMDEVQLMGAGLKTSAQLQAFREIFATYGSARSLWVSATLAPEQLQTVDLRRQLGRSLTLNQDDLQPGTVLRQRYEAQKQVCQTQTQFTGNESDYAKALAREIQSAHQPGTLTLVICNRVSRSRLLYQALAKLVPEELLPLVHSRFRRGDRQKRQQVIEQLRRQERQGILVSTQAIEAGVDISAQTLFTELAPWAALQQRFGRCNRYGTAAGTIYWIDLDTQKKGIASPYEAEELDLARNEGLNQLTNASPQALEQIQIPMSDTDTLIPRRTDLLQLFDTTVDLAGHDIDISPFIRESSETDVAIAWRNWHDFESSQRNESKTAIETAIENVIENIAPPQDFGELHQDEICRVNLYSKEGKEFLEKVKQKGQVWVRDRQSGGWEKAKTLYPGMTILLPCAVGGYSQELGFTGNPADIPESLYQAAEKIFPDQEETELLTAIGCDISLVQHAQDVALEVSRIGAGLPQQYGLELGLLERAGRWHDLGKAHPAFQEMLKRGREAQAGLAELLAKSAENHRMTRERRGFRHELVSALVALAEGEEFLLAYLVAAHHGRIRLTIQPRPKEHGPKDGKRFALGVWEGDEIPAVDLGNRVQTQSRRLSLACMELGDAADSELQERELQERDSVQGSWTAQAIALLEAYGPFRLAFLEMLIRVADWRVSERYTQEHREQRQEREQQLLKELQDESSEDKASEEREDKWELKAQCLSDLGRKDV